MNNKGILLRRIEREITKLFDSSHSRVNKILDGKIFVIEDIDVHMLKKRLLSLFVSEIFKIKEMQCQGTKDCTTSIE